MPPTPPYTGLLMASTLTVSGFTKEANILDSALIENDKCFSERAVSFSNLREASMSELAEVDEECSISGWDGYDSEPLSAKTIARARDFILALHPLIADPQVSATSTGEIALDWYWSDRMSMTLLIGEGGRLAFAYFDRDEEVSGTISFLREVPDTLSQRLLKMEKLVG